MEMNVDQDALSSVKVKTCGLMDENWDDIWKMFRQAFERHCKDEKSADKKFKYKISIGATLQPKDGNIGVSAAFKCGLSLSDETEVSVVSSHPEFDLGCIDCDTPVPDPLDAGNDFIQQPEICTGCEKWDMAEGCTTLECIRKEEPTPVVEKPGL